MKPFRALSAVEQLIFHLREEIRIGGLDLEMPGVAQLVRGPGRTDTRQWVPRILQWVDNVANGKDDRRKTFIHAEIVEGGTIVRVMNG